MVKWTDAGKAEWEQYLTHIRAQLDPGETDVEDVVDSLNAHINEEIFRRKLPLVAKEDVVAITASMGETEAVNEKRIDTNSREKTKPKKRFSSASLFFMGVVLPLIALAMEASYRICKDSFFDPLPTIFHEAAFLLIPLINISRLWSPKRNQVKWLKVSLFLNALALSISVYFTLVFLPILPMSLLMILALGLGLCGLSPLLALTSILYYRNRMKATLASLGAPLINHKSLVVGCLAGFALIAVAEVPILVTEYGIAVANGRHDKNASEGVEILRRFGKTEILLAGCEGRGRGRFAMNGKRGSRWSGAGVRKQQELYYKVTGELYSETQFLREGRDRRSGWDFSQGQQKIGQYLPDISLSESVVDGSIDANGFVGYVEWTMGFQTTWGSQREARMKIKLPEGGVVSRLTLWVNGKPQEAAFAKDEKVKAAYGKIVVRKRDPVLVTYDDEGQVFVQCFPITDKTPMKIRIGVSFPLVKNGDKNLTFKLPKITNRNFRIPDKFKHQVWMESKQVFKSLYDVGSIKNGDGVCNFRHKISDEQYSLDEQRFIWQDSAHEYSWSVYPLDDKKYVVSSWKKNTFIPALPLMLVVDGSLGLSKHKEDILNILADSPDGLISHVIVALDMPMLFEFKTKSQRASAIDFLKNYDFIGGRDNLKALSLAFDSIIDQGKGSVFWVHGPQPYALSSVYEIDQKFSRRRNLILNDMALESGINNVLPHLEKMKYLRSISSHLIKEPKKMWNLLSNTRETRRLRFDLKKNKPMEGSETSTHLARLFANQEIIRLHAQKGFKASDYIRDIIKMQIVTPITGAVVLENAEQYKENNLNPVDPQSVPSIPEPETWALIIISGIMLCWLYTGRKKIGAS